ncbi:MAG TPA: hypothetical protein VFB84_06790 [Micromonosporaceae bacterium]|nr:hypothetical protein [Micromonosporaceae bacterium]
MRTGIEVTLAGPAGAVDARQALVRLSELLDLLAALEHASVDVHATRRPPARSKWTFSDLGLGSVRAALAPLEPRPGASFDDLDQVPLRAVEGFARVEDEERLPDGWSVDAARKARTLAAHFGATPETGMRLALLVNGEQRTAVHVTRRAAVNLSRALQVRRESIGSLTGRIDSMSLHAKPYAGLWRVRGGNRVIIELPNGDLVEQARHALGQRVQVHGRISRNEAGQILHLRATTIEVLPDESYAPPLTHLVGADPDITGGMEPVQYLEALRGSA